MRLCSLLHHWRRKSTCSVKKTAGRVGSVLQTVQKNLIACFEPVYLEFQCGKMYSWYTWCVQQQGQKEPSRSNPRKPAPWHPSVSVRRADSDPHASCALSPKPKEAGQSRQAAAPMLCAFMVLYQAMAVFAVPLARCTPSNTHPPDELNKEYTGQGLCVFLQAIYFLQ